MANEVVKIVLRASVAEHIAAFRALSDCTPADIKQARLALRNWIGSQQDSPAFAKLDDMDILIVLLEEFANFAIFVGEEIEQENAKAQVHCAGRAGNA